MSLSYAHVRLFARMTTVLVALNTLVACGDGSVQDKADTAVSSTADVTRDIAHDTVQLADTVTDEVADGGRVFGRVVTQAATDLKDLTVQGASDVGSWIDGPALAQRRQKCKQERGSFVDTVVITPCKEGKCTVTVNGRDQEQACEGETTGETLDNQCVHTTWTGQYYFNDGPSVPHAAQRLGGMVSDATNFVLWNSVFWDAAVNHDYCYHHGQMTYGYDHTACDTQFLNDLMAICSTGPQGDADWFDEGTCANNAHFMYAAVRGCGSSSFAVMNTRVSYPNYEPMYKKLGLKEQPVSEELRDTIDSVFN